MKKYNKFNNFVIQIVMSRKNTNKRSYSETDDSIKPSKKGHWSLGLLDCLDDPQYFVQSDDLVTVIKDKYPKAEVHYLVIPKENIANLKSVTYDHLPLLKHMQQVGKTLSAETFPTKTFKIGYHAEPSMFRLHLHVISDDMNSSHLKTKKHWNSFNTDFFLDANNISSQLEESRKLDFPSSKHCKELLQTSLKCNKCSFIPKHIPELKKHLLTHTKL